MVLDTPSDGRYRQTSKKSNANANANARCARALRVAREHGKRKLKTKEETIFLLKSQIPSLIGKIRSKTCFGLAQKLKARHFVKGVQYLDETV